MIKRLLLCSLLVIVVPPSNAFAKPNDQTQVFTGTAHGTFTGRDWHLVPGTRQRVVAPGRFGTVEVNLTFVLSQTCEGLGHCETAIMFDGIPVGSEEDAPDGQGLAIAEPGSHTVQLAVRSDPTVVMHVDGAWLIHVSQLRN